MESWKVQQQDPERGFMFTTVCTFGSKSDAVAYRKWLDEDKFGKVVVKTLILHTIERVLSDEESE